jgi:hypothetical protein
MGGIRLVEPVEGNAAWVGAKTDDVPDPEMLACEKTVKPRVTILTKEMLGVLLDKGIEIKVTEDEIANMAKGDALSKTIFALQSSWFIVQCITRVVQGLALTQLELTTLALASLNGITMILWWKKPLGAQTVVRVYLKDKLTEEERTGETARSRGVSPAILHARFANTIDCSRIGCSYFPISDIYFCPLCLRFATLCCVSRTTVIGFLNYLWPSDYLLPLLHFCFFRSSHSLYTPFTLLAMWRLADQLPSLSTPHTSLHFMPQSMPIPGTGTLSF